jgi:hypothetical protein
MLYIFDHVFLSVGYDVHYEWPCGQSNPKRLYAEVLDTGVEPDDLLSLKITSYVCR